MSEKLGAESCNPSFAWHKICFHSTETAEIYIRIPNRHKVEKETKSASSK